MDNEFYLNQQDLQKYEEPELKEFEEEDLSEIDRAYEEMRDREDGN